MPVTNTPSCRNLRVPDGSERRVAIMYLDVKGRLADANLGLESLRMDARGSVEISLLSGQVIRLGKHDVETQARSVF